MTRAGSRGYPITAWSAANALGRDTRSVLAALRAGATGLGPGPEDTPFPVQCGAVPGPLPEPRDALREYDSRNNRIADLALRDLAPALEAALERWGPERIGLVVGSSTGSMLEAEQVHRQHHETGTTPPDFDFVRHASLHALLAPLRVLTGITGPVTSVSTACSSSAKVMASAMRWLDLGVVDAVVVGGVDSLCQMTLRGFKALSAMSADRAKPFSAERDGINIGEGGAFLLVERTGDGPRLLGVGESADAHHMSAPDPTGGGARLAMARALLAGRVEPAQVDHVNAHGTGTQQNDAMEALAIRAALGPDTRASVVSTKAYTGHMLGAAGATEAIFALQALAGVGTVGADAGCTGFIPASLGASPVDPAIDLDIVLEAREGAARYVLSNSFAFGGSNVSVLFGAAQ